MSDQKQISDYRPLPITIFLGLLLFILAGISNYLHFTSLQSQLEASIRAQSQMIADNIAPALQFMDDVTAMTMLNSLKSNTHITSALLSNQRGGLFSGWLTHQEQVYAFNQSPIAVRAREVDLRMSVPIVIAGQIKGDLTVDYSRDVLKQKMLTSILGSMSVILLMMLVTYVLLLRIKQVQQSKQIIEQDHQQTKDSIKYASLIQNAFMPNDRDFERYFSEHFCIWRPKDIVGGDIYTLVPLRHEDEVLLMVIDCTGHGVPGAFVSMLVKAIEQQIVTKLLHQQEEEINPAHILVSFNQALKALLHQQDIQNNDTLQLPSQHAGFDGAVLYYDRQRQLMKFAGANLSLFYFDQGQVSVIKGNRSSVGYHTCDAHYAFTEHQLLVSSGMSFYLTTDGYTDQNGGEKGLPFGKRKFLQLLTLYQQVALSDQAQELMVILKDYQKNELQTDDITVIGVKI